MELLARRRHHLLIGFLFVLFVAAAWPGLALTHYAVKTYGALLGFQLLLMGFMAGQMGESRRPASSAEQTHTPVAVEVPNDGPKKGSVAASSPPSSSPPSCRLILAVVAAIATIVIGVFGSLGLARCTVDDWKNVTTLGNYVFGLEPGSCNQSLTTLVRRQPYLTTDLDNFMLCQDDYGVAVAFVVLVFLQTALDAFVIWHYTRVYNAADYMTSDT